MAAEMVGGALLSSFLNVLFDRLATKEIVNLFRGKKVVADLLAELKIRLLSANSLLNDAEEKQFRDPNVKNWLEELKEVLYKADHVMDKINTEALRRKVEEGESGGKASWIFNFMSKNIAFENAVKSELQQILESLRLLLDQNNSLGLKDCLGLKEGGYRKPLQIRPHAPLVQESNFFGRDAEKASLIQSLLSNSDSGQGISVISIVGMGGIGKTTLTQLVYNDDRVKDHFTLRAWVTVSVEFDVFKITRIIFETITSEKCAIKEQYQLQDKLKGELMGKKFLIVLDDVWNENRNLWDCLKSPFEFGANGSRIIVTTRNESVASKMGTARAYNLQTISDEDSWNLFVKYASFDKLDAGARSNLQKIGFEIVQKCKGLPLAVKSIARLLDSVSDQEEWRRIQQSDVWELQFEDNQNSGIPPALWLSYYFLPQELKRCFAYCSIFPKDYQFQEDDQERVVLLWMAEGLLHGKRKRMEDVGKEYLDALISKSFFQQSRRDGKSILHMHDLVHDLAIHMSGEFYSMQDDSNYLQDNHTRNIYHLSYSKKLIDPMKLEDVPQIKCLRTLLSLPLPYVYFLEQMLMPKNLLDRLQRDGDCLRVLSLSQSSIPELPDSIGNLKHLRYLDLSGTHLKELPSSVCTLYNLQTLLLSSCRELEQLPTNMCSLISLRHLVIRNTALKEMPPQMYNLTKLQTLSDFVLGENGGSRIKELGALKLLHCSLRISGIENVVNVRDVVEADLMNKEYLTELILKWNGGEADNASKEKEVLNALEPHRKLKKLKIEGYRGTMFPDWVANQSFGDLVDVCLEDCPNCCLLPSFGQLPSLGVLKIRGMYVSGIENECFGASLTKSFPLLKSLFMSRMYALERWPAGANQEGRLFPCLKHIYLSNCDKLNVGLPIGCLPSLKSIQILRCKEMMGVFPASQEIDNAYPSLESIELWYCEKVESFSEMGLKWSPNLKILRVVGCNKLIVNIGNWNLQRLSNLQTLELNGCEELGVNSFPEEELLPSALTSLDIGGFKNLKALDGKGFRHLTSLQYLRIAVCEKLECLPEEGLPLSLSTLGIIYCPLLRRRCRRETGEDWPKIQHIPTIYINYQQIREK